MDFVSIDRQSSQIICPGRDRFDRSVEPHLGPINSDVGDCFSEEEATDRDHFVDLILSRAHRDLFLGLKRRSFWKEGEQFKRGESSCLLLQGLDDFKMLTNVDLIFDMAIQ